MDSVGVRLKSERLAAGYTQVELAEAVGVSKATISKWETESAEGMGAWACLNLCRVLHVEPEWLLFGEGKQSLVDELAVKIARIRGPQREALLALIDTMGGKKR